MKRNTTTTVLLQHDLDLQLVEQVRFLFKQIPSEQAKALLIKEYAPGQENAQIWEKDGVFYIPFSLQDTQLFLEDAPFYCDPRVILKGGEIPETEIITLHCRRTLWGEQDG